MEGDDGALEGDCRSNDPKGEQPEMFQAQAQDMALIIKKHRFFPHCVQPHPFQNDGDVDLKSFSKELQLVS